MASHKNLHEKWKKLFKERLFSEWVKAWVSKWKMIYNVLCIKYCTLVRYYNNDLVSHFIIYIEFQNEKYFFIQKRMYALINLNIFKALIITARQLVRGEDGRFKELDNWKKRNQS